MSELFDANHRVVQERFETRALADRIEGRGVHGEVHEKDRLFIESRDMFFLATVDNRGQPTCSYKGGEPGFVKVVNAKTIAFPSYDGNGMFLSLGNVLANPSVGVLFIDFERPSRLRLHGPAAFEEDDPLLKEYPGADLVVRVTVSAVFSVCPRYVHQYKKVGVSRNVPKPGVDTAFAQWKRVDALQDVLPPRDRGKTERAGGTISAEEYWARVAAGKGESSG